MSPGFLDIEGTAIYKRGEELAKQPVDDTPTSKINRQETTTDSIEAIINNAFARAGLPKLEYPLVVREQFILCMAYQLLLHIFQEAWERQLPSLPFHIKMEIDDDDGHLYLRQPSGEWREETEKWSRRNVLGPIEELKQKLEENGLIGRNTAATPAIHAS